MTRSRRQANCHRDILYLGELMFFFEGKIELFNILILGILPVGVPVMMYFIGRKRLWLSPFITLAIGLLVTAIFYPYLFTDIFTDSKDTTTGYWLFGILPVHFMISVIATAICYVYCKIRKRRN